MSKIEIFLFTRVRIKTMFIYTLSYTVVLVLFIVSRGLRGGDGMVIGITPMQSVPINTKVVSLNPAHGEVYSIQAEQLVLQRNS
jgi:hypothetical protein